MGGLRVGMPRWTKELQKHWLQYIKWTKLVPVIHGTKHAGVKGILKDTGLHNSRGTQGPGVYCAFYNNQSGQLDLSVLKTALQYGVGDYKTGITRHVLAVCDRKQVHFCRHSQWLVATDRAKFAKFPLQKVEDLFKREEALSTDDNGKRISEKIWEMPLRKKSRS